MRPWSRLKSSRDNPEFTQPSFCRSTHHCCIHRMPAADDRFTVVMTTIAVSEFSSFCRPLHTSLGSSRIVKNFRLPGIVISRIHFHTGLIAEECVHRVRQIRTHALHWHERVVLLRLCYLRQSSFDTLVGKRGGSCNIFEKHGSHTEQKEVRCLRSYAHWDLWGRKINFTNSKTLDGGCRERNDSVTLACTPFHFPVVVFFACVSFHFSLSCFLLATEKIRTLQASSLFRLCGSPCVLPLTHDVHHGWSGMCVNSCFFSSISDGSEGARIIPAPASAGILSLDPLQLVARLNHSAWTNSLLLQIITLFLVRLQSFTSYA